MKRPRSRPPGWFAPAVIIGAVLVGTIIVAVIALFTE